MTRSYRSALGATVCLIAAMAALTATASANVQVGSAGWLWGNPLPQGNSLRDIAFTGTTGYAVGDFGTIVKTTDAGATWTGLPAGTFTGLTRVEVAGDGTVIAGGGCVMRISTDGGTTFGRIPFTASEVSCPHGVVAFSYQSKTAGYNLLDDGEVQHTTDGGQSFLSNTTGVPGTAGSPTGGPAKPLDIAFMADGTTGFASTTAGNIYRTTDGAQTWSLVYSGVAIRRILVTGPLTAYAVGDVGTFLTTTDGGVTWTSRNVGTNESLTGISCVGASPCVMSTSVGDIVVQTPDGGATFNQPHPPIEVNAAALPTALQAVLVGDAGGTAVSADAGLTYTRVGGALPSTSFNRLRAGATDNTAYAVGANGTLAATTNGGRSWSLDKVTGASNVIDVSFPTPSVGWALDSTGALYTTSNGAVSWSPIDIGTTVRPNAVYSSSASDVMVVGPLGVRVSTNGGRDFTPNPKINRVPLTDVDKAGGAVIVYGPQLILESTNGGKTWTSVLKPGKYRKVGTLRKNSLGVLRVDFVSPSVGFLLDADGRVWSTRNTGKTWKELTATGTEEATGMAFSSATQGYLIVDRFGSVSRDSGFLLRTSDGGQTWHPQFILSDPIQAHGIATGGSADYLLSQHASLLSTTTGGDRGKPSTLAIKPSLASLSKARPITVSGTLTPASGFEQVVVSERRAGSLDWEQHFAQVDSNGKFTTAWSDLGKGDNLFVAQWQGDFRSDGAGTRTLVVHVGPKTPAKK